MASYKKFAFMLMASFIIMYSVMFLNVYQADHIYLSLTRFYMTLLMVSPMAVLMISMMKGMYTNQKLNTLIVCSALIIFVLSLVCLRTQFSISDVQYVKAMIPHHSSAILVSKYADLKDPEVKKLSQGIITSQEKEIMEMKRILERLDK